MAKTKKAVRLVSLLLRGIAHNVSFIYVYIKSVIGRIS